MSSTTSAIFRKVAAQGFSQAGEHFFVGRRFHNVPVAWPGGRPYINLPGVSGPLTGANIGDVRKGSRVSVELTDFQFFPHISSYSATFRLLTPGELAPQKPAAPQPAAAVPKADPVAVLSSVVAKAETVSALIAAAGKLKREAMQISAARVQQPLEAWIAKVTPQVQFYHDAVTIVAWTQEAVRQNDAMLDLGRQLGQILRLAGKPEPPIKVPEYKGSKEPDKLRQLDEHQYTPARMEQERAALAELRAAKAAELAAQKAAEAIKKNPFFGRGNLDQLLAACATPETPGIAEWLKYVAGDEGGKILLEQYPGLRVLFRKNPQLPGTLMVSLKAILADLETPKA